MQYNLRLNAILILLTVLLVNIAAQDKPVVAEFGKYSIYLDEFEKAYAKNMGGIEEAKNDSLQNYKNFLDLYINFRMKLRDAQVRAYDRDEDLIREFDNYRKQVGSSYIIEKEIIEPNLLKYYEDQRYEVRVSHIMIRPSPNFEEAEKKAYEVIEKIKAGEKFEDLASKFSDDQYTKALGGDIYWVTAGQVIPEFEMAVFSTKPGEIYPEPLKTKYGYHIIKVTKKQLRRYQLRAKHILVSTENTPESAAKEKIMEVILKLNQGDKFEDLAKEYSDDKRSAANGGDLGFISRRMMVQPFDEALFNLKVGERSDLVKTRFGYHLIKLEEEKPYPEFNEISERIREQYKKSRYDYDLQAYIDSLKLKYNYVSNENLIKDIGNYKDTVRFDDSYFDSEFRQLFKDKVIMTVNSHNAIVDSLFSFGMKEKKVEGQIINNMAILNNAVKLFSRKLLLDEAAIDLEKSDKEFAALMEDYKNGIYIFKLQEEEVWDRIKIDSVAVRNYWEANKSNYTFPDRVDFSEIMLAKDSVANDLYSQLMNGADFDSLANAYTRRPTFKRKNGHHGITEVSGNVLAEKAYSLENKNDVSKPFKSGANWSIVKLIEKYPAGIKTFDEARAEASSDYQETLVKDYENDYINKLKELYKPKYNYEVLNNAFKDNTN